MEILNMNKNLFDISNFDYWVATPSLLKEDSPISITLSEEEKLTEFINLKLLESTNENLTNVSDSLFSTCKSILKSQHLSIVNQRLLLRLLANISSENNFKNVFKNTELQNWVKKCSENDNPRIFLEAWKILQNMSKHDSSIKYVDGIYPLIPPWDKQTPVADIVLVHGIKGGASYTWRQNDSCKYFPVLQQSQRQRLLRPNHDESLSKESLLNETYSWIWPLDWISSFISKPMRLIAVDYSSDWWYNVEDENRNYSLEDLSSKIHKKLKAAGVGSRPIIWMTHSMGGLIVKTIIKNEASRENEEFPSTLDTLCSTRAVIFLSVPHFGTPVASWACLLSPFAKPSRYIYDMKAGSSSLNHTHKMFMDLCQEKSIEVLTLNESKPFRLTSNGPNVMFVPSKYGNPEIGQFHEIDASHLDVCKPTGRTDEKYRIIEDFFTKVLKDLFPS